MVLIHCQDKGNAVISECYQIVFRQIVNFAVATFILRCAGFVLRHIGVMETFPLPFIQLLRCSLTLACCMVGVYIIQHIDVKRKFCSYVGF